MTKSIRFYKNWNNKLDCPIFSTIRKKRSDFWGNKVGQTVNLSVGSELRGIVELVSARAYKFSDIPSELVLVDTGIDNYPEAVDVFRSMYADFTLEDEFWVLVFKRKNHKPKADYEYFDSGT